MGAAEVSYRVIWEDAALAQLDEIWKASLDKEAVQNTATRTHVQPARGRRITQPRLSGFVEVSARCLVPRCRAAEWSASASRAIYRAVERNRLFCNGPGDCVADHCTKL